MGERGDRLLEDVKIPTRAKLSALWAAVMFCYIYADFFSLHQPGRLESMLAGRIPPLGDATQATLLGVSVMMAIPAVMIFLALALPARACRWANIVTGVAFSVIVLLTMPGAWGYYIFYGSLDVVLTALVVVYAWRWPTVRR